MSRRTVWVLTRGQQYGGGSPRGVYGTKAKAQVAHAALAEHLRQEWIDTYHRVAAGRPAAPTLESYLNARWSENGHVFYCGADYVGIEPLTMEEG